MLFLGLILSSQKADSITEMGEMEGPWEQQGLTVKAFRPLKGHFMCAPTHKTPLKNYLVRNYETATLLLE